MKFRRKSAAPDPEATGAPAEELRPGDEVGVGAAHGAGAAAQEGDLVHGPFDVDEIDLGDEQPQWIDLGSLLITPGPQQQLRMQVDEQTKQVQAVLLAGPDGALELMAFAAPRGGGLWDEVRPQIAADMVKRGGTTADREGRWGPELECRITVQRGDGSPMVQPSRIIGIDGPRWLLRATLLGKPAIDAEAAVPWEATLANVVVRRGDRAMPVGDALPIVLPPQARPVS